MEVVYLILTLLVMLVGLVGTILPVLPSIPIIFGAYLFYGLVTGWQDYGFWFMFALGGLTLLTIIIDYLAGAVGARKFGGSRLGMAGSIVGAILGLIFFNIIGLIVGTFAGAMIGELVLGRSMEEATRSGWGAFVGFLAGSAFKFVVASTMIGGFIILIIR